MAHAWLPNCFSTCQWIYLNEKLMYGTIVDHFIFYSNVYTRTAWVPSTWELHICWCFYGFTMRKLSHLVFFLQCLTWLHQCDFQRLCLFTIHRYPYIIAGDLGACFCDYIPACKTKLFRVSFLCIYMNFISLLSTRCWCGMLFHAGVILWAKA